MVIKLNAYFSFFALSLLGMEVACVAEHDVDVIEDVSFAPGIYVDEQSIAMRRVREVGDILQHSVRQFFGKNAEVTSWLRELGGMRKLNELLIGREALKQYVRDLKEVKAVTGFVPAVLGEPTVDVGVESATVYDSYAVLAHREIANKQAHGELEDDELTDPDWSGHQGELNTQWVGGVAKAIKPFWWNNIYMGRFRVGKRSIGNNGLIQLPTSGGQDWVLDIRVSPAIELPNKSTTWNPNGSFKHITMFAKCKQMSPWSEMEDNALVKQLINRFYNDPSSLLWKKTGTKKAERWCAGMATPGGNFIWTPLSHPSSKSFDWWRENEGKKAERFYCRAIYHGPWVIAYRKSGDDINVRMFKVCSQTGWLSMWKNTNITPWEWGNQKKRLLKLGATDAYFGKPWKKFEDSTAVVDYSEI